MTIGGLLSQAATRTHATRPDSLDFRAEMPFCCQHRESVGQSWAFTKTMARWGFAVKKRCIVAPTTGNTHKLTRRPWASTKPVGVYCHRRRMRTHTNRVELGSPCRQHREDLGQSWAFGLLQNDELTGVITVRARAPDSSEMPLKVVNAETLGFHKPFGEGLWQVT
jgi:hypothetical protein